MKQINRVKENIFLLSLIVCPSRLQIHEPTEKKIVILQMINPEVKIITVENTPDDPRQRKPDITKAKELLGWEPKIKLRDGVPFMEEDFRQRLCVPKKA